MKFLHKILIILFLLNNTIVFSQTAGFNYQALILNAEEIQIPGTNVLANKVPLGLENVTLRFTITNETDIEYIEQHNITTDENGMVSVIVGEGTTINKTFSSIVWDGKLKYLNVELNILNNNEGFVFLDRQKILHIPQQTIQKKEVIMVATDGQLEFSTPLSITNIDKIDVYRNGIQIDFTKINNSTIKLELEAKCYKNDKIKIVQLY